MGPGVYINGDGTVVNGGTISGASQGGVWITGDGSVTNLAHATISGGEGVDIEGNGTVVNAGTIRGASGDEGVDIGLGGSVSNAASGKIMGGINGVEINGTGVVFNAGTMIGTNSYGVYIGGGGSVYNSKCWTITALVRMACRYPAAQALLPTTARSPVIRHSHSTDSYTGNQVYLESRSEVDGNIVGGGTDDVAFLDGHGEYGDYQWGFTNFATLDVGGSSLKGWDLTGTNYFSTSATVGDDAKLKVNGQLNSPYTYVYGTLGGSGLINGEVDIESYGTLSPGNLSSAY